LGWHGRLIAGHQTPKTIAFIDRIAALQQTPLFVVDLFVTNFSLFRHSINRLFFVRARIGRLFLAFSFNLFCTLNGINIWLGKNGRMFLW